MNKSLFLKWFSRAAKNLRNFLRTQNKAYLIEANVIILKLALISSGFVGKELRAIYNDPKSPDAISNAKLALGTYNGLSHCVRMGFQSING
jgi:hypothetical protein